MAALAAGQGTVAAPANSVQIEPAAAVVAPGGVVSVDVVAGAPATKLGGWQLLVSFDPAVVAPDSPAAPCQSTVSECVVTSGGAAVRVQGFSQTGLAGTVTLAQIPFRAVGAAGSSTAVSIEVVEFIDVADGLPTNPSNTGGMISIQATPPPLTCYVLSADVNPPGSGYVSADPANSGGCSYGQYGPGSSVQLTGVANSGWQFQSWSGDCSGAANPTVVTMSSDKSCTANFTAVITPSPSPTPTHTPAPTQTPTPSPTPEPQFRQGDIDCNGTVDAVDALRILRYVAGLDPNVPAGCPPIGE